MIFMNIEYKLKARGAGRQGPGFKSQRPDKRAHLEKINKYVLCIYHKE